MRAVFIWAAICAAILLAALALKSMSDSGKSVGLALALFLVNLCLLVKICKGSR